jgi:plasmid stability protein
LNIHDLDDSLKQAMRVRAALQGRSMEEKARRISGQALRKDADEPDLAARVRARFSGVGGVELEIPPREPVPRLRRAADFAGCGLVRQAPCAAAG